MPDQPFHLVAITTARPGKGPELRAAQERLVADSLQEDGCLSFVLHQDLKDPDTLVFVESWRDHASWRAHMEGAAMQRFRDLGTGPLFAAAKQHQLARVAG